MLDEEKKGKEKNIIMYIELNVRSVYRQDRNHITHNNMNFFKHKSKAPRSTNT